MKQTINQSLEEIRRWRALCNRTGLTCVMLGLAALGTGHPALWACGAMLYMCVVMDDLVTRRFPRTFLVLRACADANLLGLGAQLERAWLPPRALCAFAGYLIGWLFLAAVATVTLGQEIGTLVDWL